ncbi:MAG TPA: hypothetical protein VGH91_04665 [Gammaproteobacteria bacterium]|jgi:hypothetical protein
MEQISLIHEDIYEAIRTDVMALGGTKKVGVMLWPEKSADKAGELLANCLNRTRSEKLDPEQVLFIVCEARRIGGYAIATFQNERANFKAPEPIEPEDERARLYRQVVGAAEIFKDAMARLERLPQANQPVKR